VPGLARRKSCMASVIMVSDVERRPISNHPFPDKPQFNGL
jgi:hypothetical protein